MADRVQDALAFLLLAESTPPLEPPADARAELLAALEQERYLPFCAELAAHFALAQQEMRELLARLADPRVWTPGAQPSHSFVDFRPGPSLLPLRAGFVRLAGGARIPRHRHTDRELTVILEGALVDDQGRRYGPGEALAMPSGSVHALAVPEGQATVVALLHGRIQLG